MLNLKKIAVTGGLASGKSSVCQILKNLGAFVVNSDDIAHQLLSSRTSLGQQIISLLGTDIIENGQLNRKKIAEKVFKDSKKLEALEKLLHPPILETIRSLSEEVKQSGSTDFFVVEMPLLYEIKQEGFYDYVISVSAEPDECRKRYTQSGHTDEDFKTRNSRQWPLKDKNERANIVLHNDGTLKELEQQVKQLLEELKKQYST